MLHILGSTMEIQLKTLDGNTHITNNKNNNNSNKNHYIENKTIEVQSWQ